MPPYTRPMNALMNFSKPRLTPEQPDLNDVRDQDGDIFASLSNGPNEPAQAYDYQQAFNDEATERMGMAKGEGDKFNYDRIAAMLNVGKGYLDRSPITKQQELHDDFNANQSEAYQEGFDGWGGLASAKKAQFNRNIASQKASADTDVAHIEQSGARARNLDTIGGQRQLQTQEDEALMQRQLSSQQHGIDLADRYADRNAQFTGVDTKGNPRFRPETQANITGLLNRLGGTRSQLRGRDPFDTPDDPVSQTFMQDLTSIISSHSAGDDAKADVWKIMRNPQTRKMRVEDLTDASDDPSYVAELRDLLNIARGNGLQQ